MFNFFFRTALKSFSLVPISVETCFDLDFCALCIYKSVLIFKIGTLLKKVQTFFDLPFLADEAEVSFPGSKILVRSASL